MADPCFVNYLIEFFKKILDSGIKILPALIGAYCAYRMWYLKLMQDKVDTIIKGCLILKYFCKLLSDYLDKDPNGPNPVDIDAVNKNLESVLITETLSSHLGDVLETYTLWQQKVYFPNDEQTSLKIKKQRELLKKCTEDCEKIVKKLRKVTPSELNHIKLSSL